MPELMKSRTVSVSIAQPPQRVYDFTVEPDNFPRWAPAFCRSIVFEGGEWVIQTPDGTATVRFAARNPFGVLDHEVEMASGQQFHSVMRVVPNGDGSEICFTLFQWPGMTDAQYAEDARLVESDLRNLKRVLEGG